MGSKRSSVMVEHLPLTQLRVHLGAVIKRVHLYKVPVILEKDGIPVAGLLDIDEFEDYLELQDPDIRAKIRESAAEYRAGKSRPATEFLADLRRKRRKAARRKPRS